MISKPMSLSRLRELVAAYGASPERFPESERAAAQALLKVSDHARMLAGSEQSLDTWLDAASAPALSSELEQRLAAIPRDVRGPRKLPVRRRALWAPAVGWAAAALIGLWIGTTSAEADTLADAGALASTDDAAFGDASERLLEELEEIP